MARIEVSQAATCLDIGGEVALPALAFDAQGLPVNTALTWQSSNPSVATVSVTGLARGIGLGEAFITARSGSIVSNEIALSVPCSVLVLERWTGSTTYRYSSSGPDGSETRVTEASKVMLEGQRQSTTRDVTVAAVAGDVTYEVDRTETGGCTYKEDGSGTIEAALGGFLTFAPTPEPPSVPLELRYFGVGLAATTGTFIETCPPPRGVRTGASSGGELWLAVPGPPVVPDFYKCGIECINLGDEYTKTEVNGPVTTSETWTWSFRKLSGQ